MPGKKEIDTKKTEVTVLLCSKEHAFCIKVDLEVRKLYNNLING